MTYTTLDYALKYAEMGWLTFPVKPGDKTPLVKWADECTIDPEKIRAWFQKWPDANIGVVTGAKSGILVLDIDASHGGNESLMALMVDHGRLPDTVVSLTGGGGQHFIFKYPGVEIRNSAGKAGVGIDVRGEGGYICVPPSLHPSGKRYIWEESSKPSTTPLAAPPQWLIGILCGKTAENIVPSSKNGNGKNSGYFVSGQRNNALTSLAGTMRRRGMSETAIYSALATENTERCVPPLSADEINVIAKSVYRYEPKSEPEHTDKGGRQRAEVEYLFAASVFAHPELAKNIGWLRPFMIVDAGVRGFWDRFQSGCSAVEAASENGILDQIKQFNPDSSRMAEYANQIARFGYLGKVRGSLGDISHFSDEGDVSRVHQIIRELADEIPATGSVPVCATDGLLSVLALITDDDRSNGIIRTRIGNFDNEIGGLEIGCFSILAARPSVGKTTLAWQIARNAAADRRRVEFFSLEMSARSLWGKAVEGIAEVRHRDVLTNSIPESVKLRMQDEIIPNLIKVYDDNLLVIDDVSTTETIWQTVMQHRPDLVVIDYLGLIADEGENETLRLGAITHRLKALAKQANCHIMTLAQLNRGLEARKENKRPQLQDLRDSGHIEQDADLVLMMYRPDYNEDGKKERYNETEIIVRKNRLDDAGYALCMWYDLMQQWFYRESELPIKRVSLKGIK
jgi:replicative DNA helicase